MARAHGHRRECPEEWVVDGLAAVAPILEATWAPRASRLLQLMYGKNLMPQMLSKTLQGCFRLPLLPTDRVCADDEVVGGMPYGDVPPVLGLVCEFDWRRLIVELQGLRVVLVLVERGEFNPMAFGSDRDPPSSGSGSARIRSPLHYGPCAREVTNGSTQ